MGDFIENLKRIDIAKNKQKELHNAATQKPPQFKIRENVEVEKKRLDIKKQLGNRQLAFEKRQQAFCEKIALNMQSYNSFPSFSYSDNHDTSVN